MTKLINLRQARKAKARAEKDARAAENRVKFGRSKADKAGARADAERAETRLDGHERDRD